MPFVQVQKSIHTNNPTQIQEVRMGAHLQGPANLPRGVYLAITSAVIEEVGWKREETTSQRADKSGSPLTRVVCRIAVNEGVGKDQGFLLITEDLVSGYVLGTSKGKQTSFVTNISASALKHYVLNDIPVMPGPVEFTVDAKDHSVLIQAPDWLRYNSLSYKEPEKQEVKTQTRRPPTVDLMLVDNATDEVVQLNRRQRRIITKSVTQALKG